MTVSSTQNRVSLAGNGVTTLISFPYYFLDEDDLTVILVGTDSSETIQTITTHYTVSGAGNASGGSVTMVTPPASGESVVVIRDPDDTQTLDLVENDPLPAEALEMAIDKRTMVSQRQADLISRSMVLSDGFTDSFSLELPTDVNTPDYYMKVKSDGSGFEMAAAIASDTISVGSGTGVLAKTSETAAVVRTITGTANEIDLSNGNGVSGNPTIGLSDNVVLPGTEGMVPPSGTTAQRPGTPTDGQLRYNLTLGILEIYQNSLWVPIGGKSYRSVTTTDTATVADDILALSGASFTQTLPDATTCKGKVIELLHLGTSLTQLYTLATTSSQTIGGYASGVIVLGQNGEIIKIISDGSNWQILKRTTKVAYLKDVKATNVQGGTATAGTQTRVLNTVEGDSEIVSLSSNQFTLQPGKYKISASAPAYRVNGHVLRLVSDPSGGAVNEIIGQSSFADSDVTGTQTSAFLAGIITITSATTYEIQHEVQTTHSTNGLGIATGFGEDEIYTVVEIAKLQ